MSPNNCDPYQLADVLKTLKVLLAAQEGQLSAHRGQLRLGLNPDIKIKGTVLNANRRNANEFKDSILIFCQQWKYMDNFFGFGSFVNKFEAAKKIMSILILKQTTPQVPTRLIIPGFHIQNKVPKIP